MDINLRCQLLALSSVPYSYGPVTSHVCLGFFSIAAHTGHLVYTLGTLGQCQAWLLRTLKAWRRCTTRY